MHFSFTGKAQFRRATLFWDSSYYSKEDAAIALVFTVYDGSWTNNLLVVILFRNWAMHIF